MGEIYPKELILVPDKGDGKTVPYCDLKISIKDFIISTTVYDKRDTFGFPIVNFPFLKGNIPQNLSYGVFTCELVRYARICTFYSDFQKKGNILVSKLLNHFYQKKIEKDI